ncbi:hypothetical protein FNV43_RR22686 [Rhamnella rubrinervis]|uniref:Uncharacterized protein n=1 Tax=Rhamnella rubrinervis TaxID=2594499 RepID=A0A8K0GVE5_9ROSA|nr:hypothetical protein FNV43_RR22686 [Rhamnella rubrinervis]
MKSPCAILALLPLLLFARTIESRNEPGASSVKDVDASPAKEDSGLTPDVIHLFEDFRSELLSQVKATPGMDVYQTPMESLFNMLKADPDSATTYADIHKTGMELLYNELRANLDYKTAMESVSKKLRANPDYEAAIESLYNKLMTASPDFKTAIESLSNKVRANPDVATTYIDAYKTAMESLYNKMKTTPYASPSYVVVPEKPPVLPSGN